MRSIGEALPRALKSLGISRRTREAQALWLWPKVIGADLARESQALRLSGGTLLVTAHPPCARSDSGSKGPGLPRGPAEDPRGGSSDDRDRPGAD